MTNEQKVARVKLLVNDIDCTTELATMYLEDAESSIMQRAYPFRIPTHLVNGVETPIDMPSRYDILQCKLASRYFLRRGAEGERNHNENGINRTYDSANDEDLLCEVMQVVI